LNHSAPLPTLPSSEGRGHEMFYNSKIVLKVNFLFGQLDFFAPFPIPFCVFKRPVDNFLLAKTSSHFLVFDRFINWG
jgi:hypothetical protein